MCVPSTVITGGWWLERGCPGRIILPSLPRSYPTNLSSETKGEPEAANKVSFPYRVRRGRKAEVGDGEVPAQDRDLEAALGFQQARAEADGGAGGCRVQRGGGGGQSDRPRGGDNNLSQKLH